MIKQQESLPMTNRTHAAGQLQGYMLQARHMLFELISLDMICPICGETHNEPNKELHELIDGELEGQLSLLNEKIEGLNKLLLASQ